MVGAGALVKPLLGLPHSAGVIIVGITVTLIVVTAGMVSTTWVQYIKGTLLVIFCFVLTVIILNRVLTAKSVAVDRSIMTTNVGKYLNAQTTEWVRGSNFSKALWCDELPDTSGWKGKPYERYKLADGTTATFRVE